MADATLAIRLEQPPRRGLTEPMVTRVSVRQAIALAACVCALGTLPGCGSQGTASGVGGTSTTLPLVVPPKPPDASVIRAYLSSRNNPVIEFERATRALDV